MTTLVTQGPTLRREPHAWGLMISTCHLKFLIISSLNLGFVHEVLSDHEAWVGAWNISLRASDSPTHPLPRSGAQWPPPRRVHVQEGPGNIPPCQVPGHDPVPVKVSISLQVSHARASTHDIANKHHDTSRERKKKAFFPSFLNEKSYTFILRLSLAILWLAR